MRLSLVEQLNFVPASGKWFLHKQMPRHHGIVPGLSVDLRKHDVGFNAVGEMAGACDWGQLGRIAQDKDLGAKAAQILTETIVNHRRLIQYDQVDSTVLEKNIMLECDHPFLVGMDYLFQNEMRLYFVMPFVRGAELYKVFLQ